MFPRSPVMKQMIDFFGGGGNTCHATAVSRYSKCFKCFVSFTKYFKCFVSYNVSDTTAKRTIWSTITLNSSLCPSLTVTRGNHPRQAPCSCLAKKTTTLFILNSLIINPFKRNTQELDFYILTWQTLKVTSNHNSENFITNTSNECDNQSRFHPQYHCMTCLKLGFQVTLAYFMAYLSPLMSLKCSLSLTSLHFPYVLHVE